MTFDDIKLYLPKFLSPESQADLFNDLKEFPDNIYKNFYTDYLKETNYIFQGDGLQNLLIVNLESLEKKICPGMVISNSCDLSQNNVRFFQSQIVYSPIINLKNYESQLLLRYDKTKVNNHIDAIKNQYITQIFFLPANGSSIDDSIIFFDRLFNIPNEYIDRDQIKRIRLFTLGNYANYLFLFKLSVHFTRMIENIDRH
jgi:hypothetical protein